MLREEERSRDDLATGVRDARLVRIVERSLTLLAASWLLLSNSMIFLRSAVLSPEADLFKPRMATWERLEQHKDRRSAPDYSFRIKLFADLANLYFQFSIFNL